MMDGQPAKQATAQSLGREPQVNGQKEKQARGAGDSSRVSDRCRFGSRASETR